MTQSFGRYILERSIAVGGMGEVFHARQTGPDGFDRVCVVKTMHPTLATDPEIVEMFLEEARLTARLTHPHIAQVYDFGKIDSAYYLAMEMVDGPSLHTVIKAFSTRGQKLPVGPTCRVVSQAAQALDYVHRLKGSDGQPLNLVHRDISPGNLLLSRDGLVKLIDFGIAKARTTSRQTRMGQIRGKLAYMSPEQMLGLPLDGRTDSYSLGLVLYEMLSGRRANPGRNEVEILASVRQGSMQPLRSLRDDCPDSLAAVLERATARERDRRFGRASELSQALEQVIVQLGSAVGPQHLADIADEVTLFPPQPSPAPLFTPRRPPSPEARTVTVPGEPPLPSSPKAAFETQAAPTVRRGPGALPLALGAAAVIAATAAVGILLASSGPKKVEQVVIALPPPAPPSVEPQPIERAPAPEPVKSPEPVAPAAPPEPPRRSRWAKAEKFEKAAEPPAVERPPRATGPTGAVQLSSDPPTEVWVDGRRAGVTPTTLQLPAGGHEVELREPRLGLKWARSIEVSPASPLELSWTPEHGTIDVRPVPPHVELQISVDGVAVGPTPISAFSVWEGSRRISALNTATGWQTEKSVDVPPGGRVRVKVNDGDGMEVTAK